MKVWRTIMAALLAGALGASRSDAAGPTVAQVLALKPTQVEVVYDTPQGDAVHQCKLEVLKKPTSGWILRDHRGLVIRRFVDSNNDNVVDRWSFFQNGQEIYRDIDSNFNGKSDQCRWFNTGGTRWGIDENEDGQIDEWREISAEEASAEAVRAILSRNFDRLKLVLLAPADLKALGMNEDAAARVQKLISEFPSKFQKTQLPKGAQWTRFDGHNPTTVPGNDVGAAQDLFMYTNVTILADAGGKTYWLRVPEVVRVGQVWKLTDVPTSIDPDKTVPSDRVMAPALESGVVPAANSESDDLVEDNEEIQKLVQKLQQLDQAAPTNNDGREMIAYHVQRAEICAHVGSKSKKLKNREHWYKQTADSLNAAAQTGNYAQGITTLGQYADQFNKTSWGKTLAAYFKYRAVNSAYAVRLNDASGDHQEAQKAFLAELRKFLEQYPGAEDTPDALWQLGNGTEFSGKDEESREFYKRLASEFPKTPSGQKAAGALRRLESTGQPFQLAGNALAGTGRVDTTQLRGQVLLVHFWSTWCEPCKAEMPRLVRIREKYKAAGLELVGVCLDGNKQAALAYAAKGGLAWPQIFEEGSMESAPAVRYGIISLPYMMLVDADGRVLNRNLQFNQLEAEVEKAMTKRMARKE